MRIKYIIFGIVLFLVSCGQETKKEEGKPVAVEEYSITPTVVQPTDSTKSDTLSKNKEVKNVPAGKPISDKYDEGYIDGEAMAEEDRLAAEKDMMKNKCLINKNKDICYMNNICSSSFQINEKNSNIFFPTFNELSDNFFEDNAIEVSFPHLLKFKYIG